MHDASAIKKTIFSILMATACALPAVANEDDESGIPPLRDLPDFDAMVPEDEALPQPNPETEALIREGVALQDKILKTLQSIKDRSTADAAAKEIRNLAAALKAWGDKMIAHPVEDELIMGDYEVNFLPRIRQISAEIRREGERLNTYGYFGSTILKDALIDLVRQTL